MAIYNFSDMKQDAYIIAGPTASGKSALAHKLAAKIGGVIINCDSVQIYRGIENISASPFAGRPITPDIDGIPYKLFSILDLSEQISVAEYLDRARAEYNAARMAGMPVIFVGGTGYYINALISGISPMPDISDDTRRRAREIVATDMDAARGLLPHNFKFTDPQRMARAIEVFLQTGRHITDFQSMPRSGAVAPTARRILINPPSDVLRARIAARIPQMISGGAEKEAHRIINSGWDENRAIGAAQMCAYVRGKISMEECIGGWITKTNQYAKRQRTWFRTQFAADIILNGTEDIDAVI
ncbi:MAG: tRNA (adenosine(37)-N6)-dimethylallyltransferase MiaA [Alphaproteobacteria bacterium]|nr:tRNA (adenosine(37)-N6)-dimethylallyltransferase MiaA [Alphaproteobacteria bacterium]